MSPHTGDNWTDVAASEREARVSRVCFANRQRLHQRRPGDRDLSTLQLAPLPATNGVGDLADELACERANGPFPGLQLVPGTQPFKANLVEAILGS